MVMSSISGPVLAPEGMKYSFSPSTEHEFLLSALENLVSVRYDAGGSGKLLQEDVVRGRG